MSADKPRIYVACLAAYNNAKLHGRWIDAAQEPEEIQAEIDAMLKDSPEQGAEEWAIHEYEGFEGLKVGEYSSLEYISSAAKFVEDKGEVGAKWLIHTGRGFHKEDHHDLARDFEEAYRGEWKSLEDYTEELLSDTGGLLGLTEELRCYFDFEKFAQDMELNGDVFTIETSDGMVHVFDGH